MHDSRKRSAVAARAAAVLAAGVVALGGVAACSSSADSSESSAMGATESATAEDSAAAETATSMASAEETAMSSMPGSESASPGSANPVNQDSALVKSKLDQVQGSGNAVSEVQAGTVTADSAAGNVQAQVTISNAQSQPADYLVEVQFLDGSGKVVGTGYAHSEQVAPGQPADAIATSDEQLVGTLTAKVVKAQRY